MARLSFTEWKTSVDAPLHAVFWVHFLFSSWSHLGGWSGNKFIFQDFFLLISVMWALHSRRSASPVVLALGINALSMMLDIIALAVSFPAHPSSTEEFSAVMAIFNLILRLISTYLLYRELGLRDDLDQDVAAQLQPASHEAEVAKGRPSSSASTNNNASLTSPPPLTVFTLTSPEEQDRSSDEKAG